MSRGGGILAISYSASRGIANVINRNRRARRRGAAASIDAAWLAASRGNFPWPPKLDIFDVKPSSINSREPLPMIDYCAITSLARLARA